MLSIYWEHVKPRLWLLAGGCSLVLVWQGYGLWREQEVEYSELRAEWEAATAKEESHLPLPPPDHPAFAKARTETQSLAFEPPPLREGVWDPGRTIRRHSGQCVALEGDLLAVGSPNTYSYGLDSGVVTLYRLIGGRWQQEANLAPAEIDPHWCFGQRVELRGGTLAVTAGLGREGIYGRVYVLRRGAEGEWREDTCLRGQAAEREDEFGSSVSLGAGFLVVGAPSEPLDGDSTGAVYVYERFDGSWREVSRVLPPASYGPVKFGVEVEAGPDYFLAGGHPLDPLATDPKIDGYVFERRRGENGRSRWVMGQPLENSSAPVRQRYGASADGNRLVIGGDRLVKGKLEYRLQCYERSGPGELFRASQQRLPTITRRASRFVPALCLQGDVLAVGLPMARDLGKNAGAAVVLRYDEERTLWSIAERLLASNGHTKALFGLGGIALTEDGRGVVTPSSWWGTGHWKPGAVYYHDLAAGD